MSVTKLIYIDDFDITECDAEVVSLDEHEVKQVFILNQTCFYPKGGGRDFDQGTIISGTASFEVEAAFSIGGGVRHTGHYSGGSFKLGDTVYCKVKEDRRLLHTHTFWRALIGHSSKAIRLGLETWQNGSLSRYGLF